MDWIKEENVCEMFNLTRDAFTEMFNAYVRSGQTYPLAYSPPPEKLREVETSSGGLLIIKGGYIVREEPVMDIIVNNWAKDDHWSMAVTCHAKKEE